jgi:hypothetical protein
MPDHEKCSPANRRTPWNKGKLIGARPPLRPKHVWAIRTRLLLEGRIRDLALFNLASIASFAAATLWQSKLRTLPQMVIRWTGQRCGRRRRGTRSSSS